MIEPQMAHGHRRDAILEDDARAGVNAAAGSRKDSSPGVVVEGLDAYRIPGCLAHVLVRDFPHWDRSRLGFGAGPLAQRVLAHRFAVTVNNCQTDLGSWPKVTGLDATVDLAEYRSGGRATSFLRYLRPSLNDGTGTLSRPAGSESELVQDWLAEFRLSYEPVTVVITLIDGADQPVASWELSGIVPVHWQISAFDPERSESRQRFSFSPMRDGCANDRRPFASVSQGMNDASVLPHGKGRTTRFAIA
jgi:phage tail-like protein